MISLAAAAIIAAAVSAAAGFGANALNYHLTQETNKANKEAVQDTNETNLQIAQENNAMQMDLAKNGISYKMNDLKNAGLNPILAAGGMSSPSATLSTPHMQAPQAQAPQFDFSGIASAITAMNNSLLTEYITQNKTSMNEANNATKKSISEDRNDVLKQLYQRKADYMNTRTANFLGHSADQVHRATKEKRWTKKDQREWDEMMKFYK